MKRPVISTLAALLSLALGAAGGAQSAWAQARPARSGPPPASQVPAAIEKAVDAPGRPAADRALDAGRKPAEVMAFFGIAPGMKVADLMAGGGYETELLARIVGPRGKVYSQNAPFQPPRKKVGEAWNERLKEPALSNVVAVRKAPDAGDLLPVAPGSLDAVLLVLNYHDLVGHNVSRDKMNAAVFKALKPGGVYGIVDHSAQAGSGTRDVSTLHRIEQAVVEREVGKAGFKLAAVSGVLRNPRDDRTWFVFKHRGTTDRFVLRFVKPLSLGAAAPAARSGFAERSATSQRGSKR